MKHVITQEDYLTGLETLFLEIDQMKTGLHILEKNNYTIRLKGKPKHLMVYMKRISGRTFVKANHVHFGNMLRSSISIILAHMISYI